MNNSKFSIGEIVILNCRSVPGLNGNEVEIIKMRLASNGSMGYAVIPEEFNGKKHGYWDETVLKKIPPKDTPTEWDERIFKPKGIEA